MLELPSMFLARFDDNLVVVMGGDKPRLLVRAESMVDTDKPTRSVVCLISLLVSISRKLQVSKARYR